VVALLGAACAGAPRGDPPPSASASAAAAPSGAATAEAGAGAPAAILAGKPLYSQHNEELIVRHFFRDRRGGVFLDVGCGSPIAHSNTYYLEHHLRWTGIAVDALAEYADAWRAKRPGSRFFSYMVTDRAGGEATFYRSELRGTSSALKDWKRPGGQAAPVTEIRVPTTTLDRLLEQSGVGRVDFLSMDIEGGEPPALAGFDIARFKPALACVEAKPQNRDRILEYFADHGYRHLKRYLEFDHVNYYFAPSPEAR
jgi:FkbM family methyltransferase